MAVKRSSVSRSSETESASLLESEVTDTKETIFSLPDEVTVLLQGLVREAVISKGIDVKHIAPLQDCLSDLDSSSSAQSLCLLKMYNILDKAEVSHDQAWDFVELMSNKVNQCFIEEELNHFVDDVCDKVFVRKFGTESESSLSMSSGEIFSVGVSNSISKSMLTDHTQEDVRSKSISFGANLFKFLSAELSVGTDVRSLKGEDGIKHMIKKSSALKLKRKIKEFCKKQNKDELLKDQLHDFRDLKQRSKQLRKKSSGNFKVRRRSSGNITV